MKVIGVTGGVGAGKSLILNYVKDNYNAEIIFADDLAKNLCKKGEVCFEPLVKLLGESVVSTDGEIDKGLMAAKIFEDDSLRSNVNGIIHPAVKNYILNRIKILNDEQAVDYLFIEAALLIEDGYKAIVDELWYIYADESIRRTRLKNSRGYSDKKIDDIMNSQLSDKMFRENCNYIIDNSESSEFSFKQIRERLGNNHE